MTTKANILKIAPELADRSDELFNLVIADVALQVTSSEYGSRLEEAQRYLSAHLLTICGSDSSIGAAGSSGPVTGEQMGDASKNYGSIAQLLGNRATRYDLTVYGQRFMSISRSSIPRFQVY